MKVMKVLDLCAGTGSATKAFVDRGHDVDTLDIIGGHTFNMDVRKFRPWKKYDFIWASPVCRGFSLALRIPCRYRHPDLSIVHACLRICKTAPYWILENPSPGCLEYFIGRPQMRIRQSDYGCDVVKPTGLWGYFPWFWSETRRIKTTPWQLARPNHNDPARAMIPYGLSLAICKALEAVII